MRWTALLLLASPAFAGVIAPIPRGIDFSQLKPMPKPDGDETDDPAALLDRIAKSAESLGDRLKDKDTGKDTREQQEQLLRDIDKLLKPPPPMGGGGDGNPPPPDNPPPMGGGNGGNPPPNPMGGNPPPPMPMGGMGEGQPPPPMGGGQGTQRPQRTGSRPPPMPGAGQPMPEPPGGMAPAKPMPMGPMGQGNDPMGKGNPPPPAMPLEDPFTKQVWGHLPERLRQQASEFYREQYMPKYGELLKLYYSNLAEREKAGRK